MSIFVIDPRFTSPTGLDKKFGADAYSVAGSGHEYTFVPDIWHPASGGAFLADYSMKTGSIVRSTAGIGNGRVYFDGLQYIGLPGDKDPVTGATTTLDDSIFSAVPGFSGWWKSSPRPAPIQRLFIGSRCLGFNIADRTLGTAMRQPLRAYGTSVGGGAYPGNSNITFEASDANICARIGPDYLRTTGTLQQGIWWGKESGGYELYVWTGNPSVKPAAYWGGIAFTDTLNTPQRWYWRNCTDVLMDDIYIRGIEGAVGTSPGSNNTYNQSNHQYNRLQIEAASGGIGSVIIAAREGNALKSLSTTNVTMNKVIVDLSTSIYEQEEVIGDNTQMRYASGESINFDGPSNSSIADVELYGTKHGGIKMGVGSNSSSATLNCSVGKAYIVCLDHPLADMRPLASANCQGCSISNVVIKNASAPSQFGGDITLKHIIWIDNFVGGPWDPADQASIVISDRSSSGTSWRVSPGYCNNTLVGKVTMLDCGLYNRRTTEIRPLIIQSYGSETSNVEANTIMIRNMTIQSASTVNTIPEDAGVPLALVTIHIGPGRDVGVQDIQYVHAESANAIPRIKVFNNTTGSSVTTWTNLHGYTGYGFNNVSGGGVASTPYAGSGKPRYRRALLT